jgi:hypothetical protein
MSRIIQPVLWRKWKYTERHCCTGLSAFFFSTVKEKCYCSAGHSVSTTVEGYGPIPVAVIPIREKPHRRLVNAG